MAGLDEPDRGYAAPLPWPVPRQLPATIRDFTGRTADLAALDALLPADQAGRTRPGAVVISAIDGTAGIGKTTLAIYWAHRVRDRFPDGTLYVNLRGYGPGKPATSGEVLDGFLRALGIPVARIPTVLEEQAALYRSVLAGRGVLVVLDNAVTAEQVRPMLPASEACLALVTSRSSLTGLVIGHSAARISLDLLPLRDAVELVRGIVGDLRADAEPHALVQIANACVRLPLALRIAGQRAIAHSYLPLADIATELTDRQGRLGMLSGSADEATSVRAVFDWSYQDLPPERQMVFRRLGLHPGVDISVYAAAALADTAPSQARTALEALTDVHLVDAVGRYHYRPHDLLRAYALEQAERHDPPGVRHTAVRRLLGFYLHTADAADRRLIIRRRITPDATPPPDHPLGFASDREALAWIRTEYPSLIAAARYAAETGLHDLAWQIPAIMNGFFENFGHRTDWLTTSRAALVAAQTLKDQRGQTYTLTNLSGVLTHLRRFNDAIECGRRALAIARRSGQADDEATALGVLSFAYSRAGQFDVAVETNQRSMRICRELGDSWAMAIGLNRLGGTFLDQRRLDEAVDCHEQALRIFREREDSLRVAWTLLLLGDAHQALLRYEQALTCHTQALDVSREHGSLNLIARSLEGLGNTLHATGAGRAARDHWREALDIFEEIGDPQADALRSRLRS